MTSRDRVPNRACRGGGPLQPQRGVMYKNIVLVNPKTLNPNLVLLLECIWW